MSIRDRLFWEEEARKIGFKFDKYGRIISEPRVRPDSIREMRRRKPTGPRAEMVEKRSL